MSRTDTCAATFQLCDPSVPMFRYWDNSVCMLRSGHPVAVKLPTGGSFEWFSSHKEDELFLLDEAYIGETDTVWNTLTVSNLSEYIYICLYIKGHLDSDNILQGQPLFIPSLGNSTNELAKKFANLIAPPLPKPVMLCFKWWSLILHMR